MFDAQKCITVCAALVGSRFKPSLPSSVCYFISFLSHALTFRTNKLEKPNFSIQRRAYHKLRFIYDFFHCNCSRGAQEKPSETYSGGLSRALFHVQWKNNSKNMAPRQCSPKPHLRGDNKIYEQNRNDSSSQSNLVSLIQSAVCVSAVRWGRMWISNFHLQNDTDLRLNSFKPALNF